MRYTKEEMSLRHDLAAAMKGLWLLTWHEDADVNPGVPDVSYVMKGGEYETGWLELKAGLFGPTGTVTLGVERSQHEWMENHHARVPCYFLCRVSGTCFLVPGTYHQSLAQRRLSLVDLRNISDDVFNAENMRSALHDALKKYTFRGRHGRTG